MSTGMRDVDVREGIYSAPSGLRARYAEYGYVETDAHWTTVRIRGVQSHVARVRKADIPALIRALEAVLRLQP